MSNRRLFPTTATIGADAIYRGVAYTITAISRNRDTVTLSAYFGVGPDVTVSVGLVTVLA